MHDFLKNRIKIVSEELKQLYEERASSGVASGGDYDNKIKNHSRELEKLNLEIRKYENASTPDDIKIFFYVIVSNKVKIGKTLGKDCSCHLNDDRYHDSECKFWKPFKGEPHIEELLSAFRTKYPFKEIYLDGEIADDILVNLDKNIEHSIAVIDLLSLDERNKEIALKFDTRKAGLLFPICDSLHSDVRSIAKTMREKFKTLKASVNQKIPCNLYFSDISGLQSFNQYLSNVLALKFPIKNQSTTASDLRGMSMNL